VFALQCDHLHVKMLNDNSFASAGSHCSSVDLATTPDSPLSLTLQVYTLATSCA